MEINVRNWNSEKEGEWYQRRIGFNNLQPQKPHRKTEVYAAYQRLHRDMRRQCTSHKNLFIYFLVLCVSYMDSTLINGGLLCCRNINKYASTQISREQLGPQQGGDCSDFTQWQHASADYFQQLIYPLYYHHLLWDTSYMSTVMTQNQPTSSSKQKQIFPGFPGL